MCVCALNMYHKMCSRSKPLLSFHSLSSSSTCYASLMLFFFYLFSTFQSKSHHMLLSPSRPKCNGTRNGIGRRFTSMGWLMQILGISTQSLTLNCLKLLSNSYRILGIHFFLQYVRILLHVNVYYTRILTVQREMMLHFYGRPLVVFLCYSNSTLGLELIY